MAIVFIGSVFLVLALVPKIFAETPATPPVMPMLSINVATSTPRPIIPLDLLSGRTSAADAPPAWTASSEHPLKPVIGWAEKGLPTIERLDDYTATLVRRERIRGVLGGYEYTFIKIRHRPFSVYVRFEAPEKVRGQEVVYISGRNRGHLLAHRARMPATVALLPGGMIAMSNRHYPLTEIGLVNLVRRLVEVGRDDLQFGECEVQYFTTAKLDGRPCTVVQVVHPVPRDAFRFHLVRIFVDDALRMPTRYESYDWPRQPGGEPRLIEEYTYLDLKLNVGLTDEDFSVKNPAYGFGR